jgi:glycosyltransferase involved in cell wall biosynthesis
VIVTTGQPAANPRVVKEYEALKKAGYEVKVLYTYSADWSYKIDEAKFISGVLNRNDFVLIAGDPHKKKIAYFFSRILFKLCSRVVRIVPLLFLKKITFVRSSFFLWLYAKKYKADMYIAHYIGALPAAIEAAGRYRSAVIFDAEDFHRGEESYYDTQIPDVIKMEEEMLPKVNSITTASPLISNAYSKLFPSQKVYTINNVFSKKFIQPVSSSLVGSAPSLKLFWFSQVIGPFRGLETVIEALNMLTDEQVSLHLLGNIREKDYVKELLQRSQRPHNIHLYPSLPPEEVFTFAAQFDIGLAAEITDYSENRNICLTNKIFTYLLAGLCVMASDTSAQEKFMQDNPEIGGIYGNSDPRSLATQLHSFYSNPSLLAACKKNASTLADNKLNWENESEKLLQIVKELIS